MICPVELGGDLSALRAARVGDYAGHGFLHAEEFGYDGLFRPAAGQALAETGAGGAGGASAGALSRSVFRSERAAFPREVAARAPDRAELHLGEAGVALLSNDTLPADCGKRYSSRQKRPIKTKMMMISNTNPSPPLG